MYIFRVLLNTVSFSSRLVALLAVMASMVGVGLIADWQSIGYDPCTKYSVFHNPELKHNVTPLIIELNLTTSKVVTLSNSALLDSSNCIQFSLEDGLDQLRMQQQVLQPERDVGSGSGYGSGNSSPHLPLDCSYIKHENSPCLSCSSLQSDTQQSLACMSFRLNLKSSCYEMVTERNATSDDLNSNVTALLCKSRGYPLSVCVNVQNVRFFSDVEIQDFKEATSILTSSVVANPHLYPEGLIADVQEETEVVELDPDVITAKGICLDSEDNCYWNQYSQVTKEDCYSCPQICRSVRKSLNFVQFSLGAAIFVIAIPISRVVLMILISDNLSQENQVCTSMAYSFISRPSSQSSMLLIIVHVQSRRGLDNYEANVTCIMSASISLVNTLRPQSVNVQFRSCVLNYQYVCVRFFCDSICLCPLQAPFTGIVVAAGGIARTVSPLWSKSVHTR